jgi:hypothetical protein
MSTSPAADDNTYIIFINYGTTPASIRININETEVPVTKLDASGGPIDDTDNKLQKGNNTLKLDHTIRGITVKNAVTFTILSGSRVEVLSAGKDPPIPPFDPELQTLLADVYKNTDPAKFKEGYYALLGAAGEELSKKTDSSYPARHDGNAASTKQRTVTDR